MPFTKNKESGLSLLLTLTLLQVITLFALSLFELSSLSLQQHQLSMTRKTMEQETHRVLFLIDLKRNELMKKCRINAIDPLYFKDRPAAWWQNHACQQNSITSFHFFFIELLTADPCGIIKDKPGVQYFRYTMLTVARDHPIKYIWQRVSAHASPTVADCTRTPYRVRAGMQKQTERYMADIFDAHYILFLSFALNLRMDVPSLFNSVFDNSFRTCGNSSVSSSLA